MRGPLVASAGLAILAATLCFPAVPAVTAMALVAWGATSLTVARFRATPALPLVCTAHLAIYGLLYSLFVGASLHAAVAHAHGKIGLVTTLDVVVSVVPMLAAAQIAVTAIISRSTTE